MGREPSAPGFPITTTLVASPLRYPHPPGNGLAVGQLLQVPYAQPRAVAVEDDRQPVSHEDRRDAGAQFGDQSSHRLIGIPSMRSWEPV